MTVIAITGANGYVGSAITRAAAARGHEVISLVRSPASTSASASRRYDLSTPLSGGLLDGVDTLIHGAYDLNATRARDIARVNVEGTRRLVEACAAAGVRFILISSMSAYAGTRQLYGRAKLASEADVLRAGGSAVRLGLVYGGPGGGMIGSLTRVARLPVIPVIGASSHQFMVDVDDMAGAVVALADDPDASGQLAGLAHPTPIAFRSVIGALAPATGRRPVIIPIPWQPVYGAMRAAEAAGLSLPLRADSVLGLVAPAPHVPNVELWERLGVTIRAPDLQSLREEARP